MPMLEHPLGEWTPDRPAWQGPHLRDCQGVIPALTGYEPFFALSSVSDPLPGRVHGAISSRDNTTAVQTFAGTDQGLYQYGPGLTWTDKTKSGGYHLLANDRWRFTTFGDRLLASAITDPIQYKDMSGVAAFADLAGSPPKARHIAAYKDFVVLGNTESNAFLVKWSGFNNSEQWTPGTNQSDEQELKEGGMITGLVATEVCYVFQEYAITRMLYVGGDVIMSFDTVQRGIGCIEAGSIVYLGSMAFFLSEHGFYQLDLGSGQASPIGHERVDEWYKADLSRSFSSRISGAIDPHEKIVVWAYPSTSSSTGACDSLLIYNWVSQRWAYARLACDLVYSALGKSFSLDDFTTLSLDDFPDVSLDDPIWRGGQLSIGGFSSDHSLATFGGASLQAVLDLSPLELPGARMLANEGFVHADTPSATLALAGVERPGDPILYGTASDQQASGRIPLRKSTRILYLRVSIPAGATWTQLNKVRISVESQGVR